MSLFNFDHRSSRLALVGGMLIVGAGALAGGCSGGFSSEAEFCQALAEVVCNTNVVTSCYGSGSEDQLSTDTGNCIAARRLPENCNPKRLPFHADGADACLDAQESAFADAALVLEESKGVRDACNAVFNRGGPQSSSCTDDSDCDVGGGLRCVIHQGTRGTCQIPKTVEAGKSCADSDAQCESGFYCNTEVQACIENATKSGSCAHGETCGDDFLCNSQGVCQEKLANNEECTADDQCTGGFCVGRTTSKDSKGLCTGIYKLEQTSTTCDAFRR